MRLIVVEDEPIARDGLCALLAADQSVEVVGSFASAEAARRGVRSVLPDAMFVDVEMPGEGGLDFVRSMPAASRPHVVFVTAHENYAAKAFDVKAIDYVLKPIDERRLAEAVARIRTAIDTAANARMHARLKEALADGLSDDCDYLTRISARVGDRLVVVKLSDVSWIEADGDYMRVHSKGRALLVRMTMRELERRLDPSMFMRAHRSALVNIDFVTGVELLPHGEHVGMLRDGARVRIGRTYRSALFEALGERT
ncbi:MAG TPA: LytTR family DNA-binding domain-containing protein [Gemmatimonadaceae bacterium]|nr:LytTR family DNA-binding domain-containing protein [Gemmatimonadaceae bacterium]